MGKQETRSCPFYPPHPSLVSPSSSSYLLNVLVTRAYVSARTSPHCASVEKRIRTSLPPHPHSPQKTGPVTSDLLLLYNSLVVKTVKDGRRWRTPYSKDKNKGSRRTWWIQRERVGKEDKPNCKQNNANESLAEAQSCSERVPLTKPPEPDQPSLTN